jgi:HEAT repeat protein
MKRDVLPGLVKRLSSPNKDQRRTAAVRLGRLRDPRAIDPLIVAMGRGGGERAKHAAVEALARIGQAATQPLVRTLLDGTAGRMRRASAAEALGHIGDRRSLAALTRSLKDSSADVRLHATVALAQLKDPRATSYLIRALSDASAGVRLQAAVALGVLRSSPGVMPLIKALRDEKWYVRQHAATSLGRLADRRAGPALRTASKDPRRAVAAAARQALARLPASRQRPA